MRFIIDIRIGDKKRTYPVDADSEEEAVERLKLRIHPAHREKLVIDAIKIDMSRVGVEDPFGAFGGE